MPLEEVALVGGQNKTWAIYFSLDIYGIMSPFYKVMKTVTININIVISISQVKQLYVSQMTLFKQLMIRTKCYALLCVKDRKGERATCRREGEEEVWEI